MTAWTDVIFFFLCSTWGKLHSWICTDAWIMIKILNLSISDNSNKHVVCTDTVYWDNSLLVSLLWLLLQDKKFLFVLLFILWIFMEMRLLICKLSAFVDICKFSAFFCWHMQMALILSIWVTWIGPWLIWSSISGISKFFNYLGKQ